MIKSTKKQTNHVIIALMNYTVSCNPPDPDYLKFQYAYVNFDDSVLQSIIDFNQYWLNRTNRKGRQYFRLLRPITLIESEYINERIDNNSLGFEHIKLDSISYLEAKPDLTNIETYDIIGWITCFNDFFTFDTERIPDGLYYPTIIYKSARMTYSRIEDLIKNFSQ